MHRLKLGIVLATTAVMLAACGSSTPEAAAPKAEPTTSVAADAPTTEAPVAAKQLNFVATTTDGKSFDGMSLAGKPTVVWFWAPWCHICKGEAPSVRAAAESSDVEFLGVAALDGADAMKGFVKTYKLGFTNLADTKAAVWAKFGVTSQPSYAFISADGSVDVVPGSLSASELKAKIAAIKS